MHKRIPLLTMACVLTLPQVVGLACRADQPVSTAKLPQVKFTDYKLNNGLRVILSVDHAAPVVAVSVTYNVGSRNERPGRTGFAHLFEHMMFQGSQNVGKGEHMKLIQNNGGTMNGTTNQDRTNYFETVPANQLEMALYLEADRMHALDISQINLDNQRAVVQEERRQSYDNQPYGQMPEAVDDLLFSSFGYQHSTIGSMADLNAASLEDVRSFFKTYYAPNNACIAVVGDFSEPNAKKLIEKYFGGIPRQTAPPAPDIAEKPVGGEKRKEMTDRLARLTRMEIAYKTVSGDNPDSFALQMLGSILSAPRTGRIYNALVEKRLALNANAGGFAGRGPSLFSFSATVPPSGNTQEIEKIWDAEVARIQKEGVTEAEIQKAKTQARARAIVGGGGRFGGTDSVLGRANALSQFAIFYNDPGRINTQLPRMLAVTAEDIKRVANQYLKKDNRAVVIDGPESSDENPFDLFGANSTNSNSNGKGGN